MSPRARAGLAALVGLLAVALGLVVAPAPLAGGAVVPPGGADLAADLAALTAPEMRGRASGTPGGERAARHIAGRLRDLGLGPGGDAGTYLQSLAVGTSRRIGAGTALERMGPAPAALEVEREWMPHGGSLSGEASGPLVFVGFGVAAPERGWDDFAGVDVSGKIALALEGGPPHLPDLRPSRIEKVLAAQRRGARALLLVGDALPSLGTTGAPVGLVSGALTRQGADELLAPAGSTTAGLARALAQAPASFASGVQVRLRVRLERVERRAANVIGILPGTDPSRASEAVVVGAHYDHLGEPGGILHPGADDNASGTVLVLGLARAFAGAGRAPRTLVFVLFAGEEIGLLGSTHYVRHPAVPIAQTIAMVNFDMVGRLRDGRLRVGGAGSGLGLAPLVTEAGRGAPVTLAIDDSVAAASDHAPFHAAGVPVLFFFTGGHEDHHRPTDTLDRINLPGLVDVAGVAARVVERLAGAAPRPAYVKAAPPARPAGAGATGSRGTSGRAAAGPGAAFFGISPGGEESDGVPLASVVPDSAAARAGFRPGDVLVRFAGAPVNSFEELRSALARKRPGDTVTIVYLRDGRDHSTTATLGARP